MVILKTKSYKCKRYQQQAVMVYHCIDQWCGLNNNNYSHYPRVMNMRTYRISDAYNCYVTKIYHFNLNKW